MTRTKGGRKTGGKAADAAPRDRIVAAAGALFAEKGIDGTPLREIARAAGINVNLIGYYFPSKADLFDAVIDDPAEELNAEREKRLDALEERYSPKPVPVEEIVRSLLEPVFELHRKNPEIWENWIRLISRETGREHWRNAMQRNLGPILKRYVRTLHRTLPKASRADLEFVVELAIGSLPMVLESELPSIWGTKPASGKAFQERIIRGITAAATGFAGGK